MGRPVDELDKFHWFLRGLGPAFSGFGAAQMAICPLPQFRDLISRAESFEMFLNSMDTAPSHAAFFSQSNRPPSHQNGGSSHQNGGRGQNSNSGRGHQKSHGGHNNQSSGRGRGHGRYIPRCQICRVEGHYAPDCQQRYDRPHSSSNIAESFAGACNISNPKSSDWYLDTGASAHMTPAASTLDSVQPYSGTHKVIVGNGDALSISHTGSRSISNNLHLQQVLVVPCLTKNLISISQLTRDYPVDVKFTNDSFLIQTRATGKL